MARRHRRGRRGRVNIPRTSVYLGYPWPERLCANFSYTGQLLLTADPGASGYSFRANGLFGPQVGTSLANVPRMLPTFATLYQFGTVIGSKFRCSVVPRDNGANYVQQYALQVAPQTWNLFSGTFGNVFVAQDYPNIVFRATDPGVEGRTTMRSNWSLQDAAGDGALEDIDWACDVSANQNPVTTRDWYYNFYFEANEEMDVLLTYTVDYIVVFTQLMGSSTIPPS